MWQVLVDAEWSGRAAMCPCPRSSPESVLILGLRREVLLQSLCHPLTLDCDLLLSLRTWGSPRPRRSLAPPWRGSSVWNTQRATTVTKWPMSNTGQALGWEGQPTEGTRARGERLSEGRTLTGCVSWPPRRAVGAGLRVTWGWTDAPCVCPSGKTSLPQHSRRMQCCVSICYHTILESGGTGILSK